MTVLEGMDWWILRDGKPEQVTFRTYSDWMMRPFEETRRVAESLIDLDDSTVRVSTVFLTIDHNWAGGPPILFETMVFGGPESWDGWQERYGTLDTAKEGHRRIVTAIQKGEAPS